MGLEATMSKMENHLPERVGFPLSILLYLSRESPMGGTALTDFTLQIDSDGEMSHKEVSDIVTGVVCNYFRETTTSEQVVHGPGGLYFSEYPPEYSRTMSIEEPLTAPTLMSVGVRRGETSSSYNVTVGMISPLLDSYYSDFMDAIKKRLPSDLAK
jgi:hypothetical protein